MKREPRTADELTIVVAEVFDVLQDSRGDQGAIIEYLTELRRAASGRHCMDVAVCLRATGFLSESPEWIALRDECIELCHQQEYDPEDVLYGMIRR